MQRHAKVAVRASDREHVPRLASDRKRGLLLGDRLGVAAAAVQEGAEAAVRRAQLGRVVRPAAELHLPPEVRRRQ